MVTSNWVKYAQWEESQKEMQRARSIWERAIDNDHRNITIWLKYAEMEMKNRQINHARNLWDRAVSIMPRVNQFWYKYTYMEEMLENIAGAREVFERWMLWQPDDQAWNTYINFELRYKELERVRLVYERLILVHPEVKNWIKYAKFEINHGFVDKARLIYERAIEFFDECLDSKLLLTFARFEEDQHEFERASVIYKYGLNCFPKEKTTEVYKAYSIHQKKYGDRTGIENIILSKRKHKYEKEIAEFPTNYDVWFDYLRVIESEQNVEATRDAYERAISNVPPSKNKDHWRRYIYFWINYATFEELQTKNLDKVGQIMKACLDIIPHKIFTFSKVWLFYAHFEVRRKNLDSARKILGTAIGLCPRDKLYKGYINLEILLREFDRCRILYEKFIEYGPENCITWIKFAELENLLGDLERVRGIYELAVRQKRLNMPELLWKSYIDFEVSQANYDLARKLYERLLKQTSHIKVWISYANFELSIPSDNDSNIVAAREIYKRANDNFKSAYEKDVRVLLLECWKKFETNYGDDRSFESVNSKMPKKVLKRKPVMVNTGQAEGWEEKLDYVFPEDTDFQPNLNLLTAAKTWKKNTKL